MTKAELLSVVKTYIQEASDRFSDEECGSVNEALANRDESLWRKVRALVEQLEEPCQCPPEPEPSIANDPKASWRFDGEKYRRLTKNQVTYGICLTEMYGTEVYSLELGIWTVGHCPTLEKAMELADEYAQANGGWAD